MVDTRNLRRKAASARREAEKGAEEGMDRVEEYLDDFKERSGEAWEGAKRRVRRGAAETQRYAEEHPWHMAAVGVLAGILLASLMMRRRD